MRPPLRASNLNVFSRRLKSRIVAGLGTGDRLSEAENRAYGIPFPSASERREEMVEVARTLRQQGLTVWIAGGPAARTAGTGARRSC